MSAAVLACGESTFHELWTFSISFSVSDGRDFLALTAWQKDQDYENKIEYFVQATKDRSHNVSYGEKAKIDWTKISGNGNEIYFAVQVNEYNNFIFLLSFI